MATRCSAAGKALAGSLLLDRRAIQTVAANRRRRMLERQVWMEGRHVVEPGPERRELPAHVVVVWHQLRSVRYRPVHRHSELHSRVPWPWANVEAFVVLLLPTLLLNIIPGALLAIEHPWEATFRVLAERHFTHPDLLVWHKCELASLCLVA